MTNSRKGRGSGRSSIASPYRLRRSVPPSDVVRSRNKARESIPVEPERMEAEDRSAVSDTDERESAQIDGSIPESIEDLVTPRSSARPHPPSDDRPSDTEERWDEPGSLAETETESSISEDRTSDETGGASPDESAAATQVESPKQTVDESPAADFFNKSAEDAAPERTHEQSTDAWESDYYDSMSASRGSKKVSYTIYTILGVVVVALGGFYPYGGPGEKSKNSPASRVRPEAKSSPGTTPTASKTVEAEKAKPSESADTKSDKALDTTQTDPDPKSVETETVAADEEIAADDTPTVANEESASRIDTDEAQPAVANDGECCDSIEAYQEALRLNPNDTDILGKLAYFYLNKGMNLEARRFAERTVNLDPKSSTGWIVMGATFDAMNDQEAALEAYKTCAAQAVGKYTIECRNLVRERK